MDIDDCRDKSLLQDVLLHIHHWEKAVDGRLRIIACGDAKGKTVGLEAYIKTDMKPVEYNPITHEINITDPETVYVDGITFKSIGEESDDLVMALSEMYEISLPNYKMASEINFTVLCVENENDDIDELNQKYQLLIDEEEGTDSYGELFLSIDMDLGLVVIYESKVEYRKNILGAFTGERTSLAYKIKEAVNNVGSYFNNIYNKVKMDKLNMKLDPFAKASVRIISLLIEEDKIKIGSSKFGGRPDLPLDFHWPEWKGMSLSFIAQINCAEVKGFEIEKLLPESGILYFFCDAADQSVWDFDPKDKDNYRVVFADMKVESLLRWDFPEDLPLDFRFDCAELKFSTESTLPSKDSVFISDLELDESEVETLVMMEDSNRLSIEDCSINRLFGYPDLIAGEMETLCTLGQGKFCGDSNEVEKDKLDFYLDDAKEWRLLLQVDSLDKLGFMWGDSGRIYYWIRKQDLLSKDFTKVWLIRQSK